MNWEPLQYMESFFNRSVCLTSALQYINLDNGLKVIWCVPERGCYDMRKSNRLELGLSLLYTWKVSVNSVHYS